MKYLKTECNKLIQYNQETNIYKIRNTIDHIDTRLTEQDILNLKYSFIKKQEFSRLMNLFFKNIKDEWKFDYSTYKKLDNFDSTNYILGGKNNESNAVPYHKINEWYGNVILVYHWGKVYYHTISYNGYKQGQLICTKTFKLVRWANLKHCAPIMNISTKKIC